MSIQGQAKGNEMNEYDKRVANGIRFLDAVKPDWRESVNLDTFDLSSIFQCIIGQVFGSYNDVFPWIYVNEVHVDFEFAKALGFNGNTSTDEDSEIDREAEMAWLENAWREALKV
jgi:hypothetical protein